MSSSPLVDVKDRRQAAAAMALAVAAVAFGYHSGIDTLRYSVFRRFVWPQILRGEC
jgi:hypothetical protein